MVQNKKTKQNMKSQQKQKHTSDKKTQNKDTVVFPLTKENYILMGISFLIIIIGYILMAGKEDIFSFVKMNISVIFVVFGFVFMIYAILKNPKKTTNENEN